ncbi:hypothetical protein Ttaiw_01416 [Tepidimonas taiwanensis]|uniref:DUF3108 domain-containing protein n=1 Tax=Tepidimonas taiwanensis TaxID=307486 RepID=A0A554X796_9BURK|nr:hypothetical protein Ttaiw_01416 [Tepidimonas taiwanensis]
MDGELPQRSRLLASVGVALALHAAALGWLWGARDRSIAPDRAIPAPVQAHLVTPAARAVAVPPPGVTPTPRGRPAPLAPSNPSAPSHPADGAKHPATLPAVAVSPAGGDDPMAVADPPLPVTDARGTADPAPSPPHEDRSETPSGVEAGNDEPRATLAQAMPAPDSDASGPTAEAATRWAITGPLRVAYDVQGEAKGLSYRAAATLTWHVTAEGYTLEMALRAFLVGERVQRSTGLLRADGLVPLRFEDRARRERVLQFDWSADAPHGSARRDDGTVYDAIPRGAQDRLSVFAQLGTVVALGDAGAGAGRRWRIPVVGLGGLEHWSFEAVGRERITLPAGETDALHVRRLASERALDVDLWYSPALPGLPVRIVLQQPNGDRVDQRLREWPAVPPS